ncbi:putative nucleotidyltransferase-like protein [Arthrobacter sp. SLBN-83]|uniref:nucleotidyltransferase family protein n=1 Tax=Arthrobacter sp. SLBN-83 TaxID=2768449 RepID=UPI00114E9A6E|nr:nucleotidyltransferase family protein [Arthrobacter sp. SLBN-83]TQJ59904.1 putative nucleotidyltransferase-like protein [Arthrobacter sp. SLBN-83]
MTYASRKTQLEIPEGVLLGHALVARLADGLGIRVFFIKGPASVLQGLREAKLSADVDVFVDSAGLEDLLEGLHERGWRERPVDPDRTVPTHSITVHHPGWPCCIDIHFRFPGMEKPERDCFESLWANTETLSLAGQRLKIPAKELGVLFLALHALRAPALPASQHELEYLTDLTRREDMSEALLELAGATGSLAAVRPFLEGLLPRTIAVVWPEPSTEWCNRMAAQEPGSARLAAIFQAPWSEKPRMVWGALFPRPEVFLSGNIYADMSLVGQLRQHRARWARFIRALPRIIRGLRKLLSSGS